MKKMLLILGASLFAGAAQAQLVNGGLETWRNYTVNGTQLESPTSWYTVDSTIATIAPLVNITATKQVSKSADVHGGTASARIMSHNYGGMVGVLPGALSNARLNVNVITQTFTATGGTAVTSRTNSVSAWVKYQPKSTSDSGSIVVAAVLQGVQGTNGQDSVVGQGIATFSTVSSYRQMTVTINYTSTATPNRIQIGFLSGPLQGGTDSSTLFVDDVTMAGPSGIAHVAFNADVVKCYPNPTNGMLYLSSKEQDMLTWEAVNAAGQVIAQKTFTQNAAIELGNVPAGIYYYRVFDKSKALVQTGKFTMQ